MADPVFDERYSILSESYLSLLVNAGDVSPSLASQDVACLREMALAARKAVDSGSPVSIATSCAWGDGVARFRVIFYPDLTCEVSELAGVTPQPSWTQSISDSDFETALPVASSFAQLSVREIGGAPPPDKCGSADPTFSGSTSEGETQPPVLVEDPVPERERGWVEDTVEPWIREGTYVNEDSKAAYRERVGRVPRYLAALGFGPPPTAPTKYRREHIEALKYRVIGLAGDASGRKLAPKTVGPILSALKDCLGFWARRYHSAELLALVSDNRLWRLKNPQPIRRSRSLETPGDLERLIGECDAEAQVGVVLGAYSGLRAEEIVALEVRDLELSTDRPSWLTVRSGKGNKPRRTIIPPVARNVLLAATYGLAPTAHVYRWQYAKLCADLARAGRSAGLGHVHPHRLRATFITFALRASVPEQIVMQWVGHSKSDTTHGYSLHDPEIEALGVRRYEAYLVGGSA